MFGRRCFLNGICSLSLAGGHGILGTAGFAPLRGASAPLRWPKPIGSPVLESIRPAIEHSRDVFTHVDKIVEVAEWMG